MGKIKIFPNFVCDSKKTLTFAPDKHKKCDKSEFDKYILVVALTVFQM
jgi:hypothetical protein